MDIGIQCGFIMLVPRLENLVNVFTKILNANEARGRRKYIRAKCKPDRDTFNIKIENDLITGGILDISIAGMACVNDSNCEPLSHKSFLAV